MDESPGLAGTIRRAVLAAAALAILATDAAALTIRNYSASKHNRSLTSSTFIGAAYDWSGVSLGGRATMVSSSYFISANHYHPADGTSLTFRDGSGNDYSRTVSGGSRVSGTDIWVGSLTSPVPSSIHPYPVLYLASISDYVGRTFFVYGAGDVVGRNEIWRVGTRTGASGTVFEYLYDDPGLGDDEALGVLGDSGRPSLIALNGALHLLGAHYYLLEDEDENPVGNGDTFLRSYVSEIDALMGDDSLTLSFIPEPAALGLFGAGILGLVVISRRRRR